MGTYLNPRIKGFWTSLNSPIYIDKSELLIFTNAALDTKQKYICVSRPRRFGKSMALDMLAAYYNRNEDAHQLFDHLKISRHRSYKTYLNQYDVLKINMQEFLSAASDVKEMLKMMQKRIIRELYLSYPDSCDETSLVFSMKDIFAQTGRSFVILIDEWDCIFREYREDKESQKEYLDFLRMWLKDQDFVALAYMTGILPIKKYGTHSTLNMFTEYAMTDSGSLAPYFGFTDIEVSELCRQYRMDYNECKSWYDGYDLTDCRTQDMIHHAIYNPKSVVEAMLRHQFGTYWNRTETYEALKIYIQMNMNGLKDSIVEMLAGNSVKINPDTFVNDMTTFASKDDVLTLLTHLGYLTYHPETKSVSIPNKEVEQEYLNAISTMDWQEVTRAVQASEKLLKALWAMDSVAVAEGIDRSHDEIAILQYNDENSLSCTINLAFYAAKTYYNFVRELPTGKGFADICLIPRPLHMDKPAVIIELKWDRSAEGAIAQIKNKQYVNTLKDYHGNLLLAGINYDKSSKKHECIIEKLMYPSNQKIS